MYIYKLVDETTKNELQNNKRISLSRPFVEFGSERKGFAAIEAIIKMVDKYPSNIKSITPSPQCIKLIEKMREDYIASLPPKISSEYTNNFSHIISDFRIIITRYFHIYCGYFTDVNLDDPILLDEYRNANKGIAKGKCGYMKIPFEDNNLYGSWSTDMLEHAFTYDETLQNDNNSSAKIKGRIFWEPIQYVDSVQLSDPFSKFNGEDDRCMLSFIKYLKLQYGEQDERRLLFSLSSINPGESINVFSVKTDFDKSAGLSIDECLFYHFVNIYIQSKFYPRYLYLHIDNFEYKAFQINSEI